MISKEEFDEYLKILDDIQGSAMAVASYFSELDEAYQYAIDEDGYWEIENENGKVFIRCWGLGPYGDDSCSFEPKWLWATDEELEKHVDDVITQRRLWKEAREKQKQIEEEEAKQAKIDRINRLKNMSREELLRELGVDVDG